eukprot:Partr_v1_DN26305_c1_g1_i1_m43455 putative (ABC) transporter
MKYAQLITIIAASIALANAAESTDQVVFEQGGVDGQRALQCSVENKAIAALMPDSKASMPINCTNKGSKGSCDFKFMIDASESFACDLSDCSFKRVRGGKLVDTVCASASCHCQPGHPLCGAEESVDISELLQIVKGPATIKCKHGGYDGDRYNCEFDEPTLRENFGPILGANPVIEMKCL